MRFTCAGCDWRPQQVPDQRKQCQQHTSTGLVPLRATQHQQPSLPHHAGPHHQGAQHEATRGKVYFIIIMGCIIKVRKCLVLGNELNRVCRMWCICDNTVPMVMDGKEQFNSFTWSI